MQSAAPPRGQNPGTIINNHKQHDVADDKTESKKGPLSMLSYGNFGGADFYYNYAFGIPTNGFEYALSSEQK